MNMIESWLEEVRSTSTARTGEEKQTGEEDQQSEQIV